MSLETTETGISPAEGDREFPEEVCGLLAVDKPAGISSFFTAARVKKILGLRKTGHCGTLDPFATGVLMVCLNRATRASELLSDEDKVYRFTVVMGTETETGDGTGEVVSRYDGPEIPEADFLGVLDRFRGKFVQTVPKYAAVKVQGRRLYDLARKGVEVELPVREVHIRRLEPVWYRWPEACLEAHCSKGTYIRRLASDIGEALGCRAHVGELRRLSGGSFGLDRTITLAELAELAEKGTWTERLISLNEALGRFEEIRIGDEAMLRRLMKGTLDPQWESEHRERFPRNGGPVRLVSGDGRLIALWRPHGEADGQRRLRLFYS